MSVDNTSENSDHSLVHFFSLILCLAENKVRVSRIKEYLKIMCAQSEKDYYINSDKMLKVVEKKVKNIPHFFMNLNKIWSASQIEGYDKKMFNYEFNDYGFQFMELLNGFSKNDTINGVDINMKWNEKRKVDNNEDNESTHWSNIKLERVNGNLIVVYKNGDKKEEEYDTGFKVSELLEKIRNYQPAPLQETRNQTNETTPTKSSNNKRNTKSKNTKRKPKPLSAEEYKALREKFQENRCAR